MSKNIGGNTKRSSRAKSITEQEKIITIGELLVLYFNNVDLWASTCRTKRYVIQMLRDCPIASV
jgi:hypothetical protein